MRVDPSLSVLPRPFEVGGPRSRLRPRSRRVADSPRRARNSRPRGSSPLLFPIVISNIPDLPQLPPQNFEVRVVPRPTTAGKEVRLSPTDASRDGLPQGLHAFLEMPLRFSDAGPDGREVESARGSVVGVHVEVPLEETRRVRDREKTMFPC